MSLNKWDKHFLSFAKFVSTVSKDPSKKVGAVLVSPERRVVSTGYNGFARGVIDSPERYNDRETKLRMVLHAEENAISFAKQDLTGHSLFVFPTAPCAHCASVIIQAGIKRVVSGKYPKGMKSNWEKDQALAAELFCEAKVEFLEQEETVCVASGYFNPIHPGHIAMFADAKRQFDRLIVIINNDEQTYKKLGNRNNFLPAQLRAQVVAGLRDVDETIISVDEDASVCKTLQKLSEEYNISCFVNGPDYSYAACREAQTCNDLGIEMKFRIGGDKTYNSSDLREILAKQ